MLPPPAESLTEAAALRLNRFHGAIKARDLLVEGFTGDTCEQTAKPFHGRVVAPRAQPLVQLLVATARHVVDVEAKEVQALGSRGAALTEASECFGKADLF